MNKISILFIFFLISCGAPKNDLSTQHDRPDRFLMLLSKFDDKKFDTLQVYSPQDLEGEYKGVPLDSADAILFPLEIAKQHFAEPPGIFAIYKFPIDNNRTALIARTPSVYVQSSIKLFLLDRTKDTITSMIELAESWGDAGDYMEKKALLFKDQKQQLNALIWLLIGHDSSVDNVADTTIQEWNSYFLLNLSGNEADRSLKIIRTCLLSLSTCYDDESLPLSGFLLRADVRGLFFAVLCIFGTLVGPTKIDIPALRTVLFHYLHCL